MRETCKSCRVQHDLNAICSATSCPIFFFCQFKSLLLTRHSERNCIPYWHFCFYVDANYFGQCLFLMLDLQDVLASQARRSICPDGNSLASNVECMKFDAIHASSYAAKLAALGQNSCTVCYSFVNELLRNIGHAHMHHTWPCGV